MDCVFHIVAVLLQILVCVHVWHMGLQLLLSSHQHAFISEWHPDRSCGMNYLR